MFRSKKFWKRVIISFVVLPILLISVLTLIVHIKQDEIVEELISNLNEDFQGKTEINGSHISLFSNFPYISIDLEQLKLFETKINKSEPLIEIDDVYVGFNLLTILSGNMEIKNIKLDGGHIDIIQNLDGNLNILKALSSEKEIKDTNEEFHLDLKKIKLKDIDLTKFNESNGIKIEAFITEATSSFVTKPENVLTSLDTKFVLNIIKDGDTTFFKHKHLDIDTEINFDNTTELLTISPTIVGLENAEFKMKGSIDFRNDMYLDLEFSGNKKNFDLLFALAPESVGSQIDNYENKGDLTINSRIKGRSINGNNPSVVMNLSCKNGYFQHIESKKELKNINFDCHFDNGDGHKKEEMFAFIKNFKAEPEIGAIAGDVELKNFESPDLKANLRSDFNLHFITEFFEVPHFSDIEGHVHFDLDYHDVIDLKNPQKSIEELNEKYSMHLKLDDVSFVTDYYPLPIKNLNASTSLDGHSALIDHISIKIGNSDLTIRGLVDDLPAIIHHTDKPVDTKLSISSNFLDLFELTGSDSSAIDEQIQYLSLNMDFKASAKSFTESKYLPQGEFFIENFYAKLKHYPHTLHDFHADIFIDEQDLRIVDLKGMIDKSDFLFTGKLEHYEKWLDEDPGGDSKIEFNFNSNQLKLESLLSYKGENYVPEEYRHEELDNLSFHGFTFLHYNHKLESIDLNIDHFKAKMKIHPLRFENFNGRIHYEDDHIVIENFEGKMGKSQFSTNLNYYLGTDVSIRKRDNHFSLVASHLDLDQLIAYNPTKTSKKSTQVNHDDVFNIYELPFTDMTYHFDIKHLNYHRYLMHDLKGNLRTTPNHYIYIEDFSVNAAGGHFDISGYFNGENPKNIYLNPTIKAKNIDLDKFMYKFDNFGQDHIVSENLHGKFSGTITGNIHMHTDLTPKLDDSEIHMDADVTQGILENYALLHYMSDYFEDKNLDKVLFDTLQNHIDIVNGLMTIPEMTINSSLGHLKISGQQDLSGDMEYYMSIPWKMVTKTASSKLFGKNKEEISTANNDGIIYGNDNIRYVNIRIRGDENGYKFSLGKPKKN